MNEVYRPIYHQLPNRFVEYKESPFIDRVGNKATLRTAHYLDKSGSHKEMVAQVIWAD